MGKDELHELFITALEEVKLLLQVIVMIVALLALVQGERTREQTQKQQVQLMQFVADQNQYFERVATACGYTAPNEKVFK